MTKVDLVIRTFRSPDLPRLIEITIEAFDGVSIDQNIERRFGHVGERSWQWRKEQAVCLDVERFPEGVFVAERGAELVGYITTWIDRPASTGYIPNLALTAESRGQGVGRRLIEFALDFFREQQVGFARIETLEQNEVGQHLYPSLGFQELARQIHYGMMLE